MSSKEEPLSSLSPITDPSIQESKLDSTYVNNLNIKSMAAEQDNIIEKKRAQLRSARIYNLDKLKDNRTCNQKINDCCGYLAKKTKPLKSKSFYLNFLLNKIPIISMFIGYNLKSYLLPDIISGMTGNFSSKALS